MVSNNAYQFINLDYLELMSDGDDSMKKVLLEMLIEELPDEIVKMRSLEQASNWAELSSVSHKMKSTLSYVGNDTMTEANKTIEKYTKEDTGLNDVPSLMDTLETNLDRVMTELKIELTRL